MKFGDKLIQLRKKNNLSQEELAEKLGVSRQSVSKWESNNTYPETDKIVQICNIFECSMDDLINDKISDVDLTLRKNKSNLNYMFDSLLEFITDTVNMFSKMTFASGLKCMIEMAIVACILFIISGIFTSVVSCVLCNIFEVFGANVVEVVDSIVSGICSGICFVVGCIILIHTFKIRYLNYFQDKKDNENELSVKDEKISKEENIIDKKNDNKNEKVDSKKIIIRDENDKPFAFLGVFSKIIIFFIKFIAGCIGLSFVGSFIGLVIAFFVVLCFIGTHVAFVGATLGLLGSCVINALIILVILYFIFEKKVNVKLLVIVFLASLTLVGVGIGISTVSIKNLKVINETDPSLFESTKVDFKYQDNLVVTSRYHEQELHYIVDESLEGNNMRAEMSTLKNVGYIEKANTFMNDNMPTTYFYEEFNGDISAAVKLVENDLKKNQIHVNYSTGIVDVVNIYANSETINKVIENTKKLYLISVVEEDGYYKVTFNDDRVYIEAGNGITYNALTDTINGNEDGRCKVTYSDTEYGTKMYITCSDNNMEDEIEE